MMEHVLPPDQDQRCKIVEQLDQTMLVEAAAGTGKTTGMLARMVGLIREGLCSVDTLAAVTFTRKAAAELRARFQVQLEGAAREATGSEAGRLRDAVAGIERCFIGTIHSFCARLLRERPIEAGVDLAFQELDDDLDEQLRASAWSEFTSRLIVAGDDRLGHLQALGLQLDQLKDGFHSFAQFSDVQHWEAPEVELGDWSEAMDALDQYVVHMESLTPGFPVDRGNDRAMNRYEQIVRWARNRDLQDPAQFMEVLALFDLSTRSWVLKAWPGGADQARVERDRWTSFQEEVVKPLQDRWLARRYWLVIDLLREATRDYDRIRQSSGKLNYQDLLMKAASLLQDKPQVRRYFRSRFSHLLVDEFQDTDPIQAEVMMFLTATDATEQDWRQCQPVPGSLFVVGDPKQSIYRFRRADILTYNQVKEIIIRSGGVVVALTANFRTCEDLVNWGNDIFDATFPDKANLFSPASSAMQAARQEGTPGELTGIQVLTIPEEHSKKDQAIEYDADQIARTIRQALDEGATVPRTAREQQRGIPPEATPGDFMVITWGKKQLARYAQKLQQLRIPYQVTGGSALAQVPQLEWLIRCLRAVTEPGNPVALVAVLRSPLFGFSDQQLFALGQHDGRFSYQAVLPSDLEPTTRDQFAKAFCRLQSYQQWLRRLPPVAALERIAWDLGLPLQALSQVGGNVQAGSIAKALEMLREQQVHLPSAAELIDYLQDLMRENAEFDGLPARARRQPGVRLMNLHKVKGLEAPVVFLANPTGKWNAPVEFHIDRSTDQVAGYLPIYEESSGFGAGKLLACPGNWEHYRDQEQEFLEFERQRLLYVAATRAGTRFVISQKEKGNGTNPWGFFADYLDKCPRLPDPGFQSAPEVLQQNLDPGLVIEAGNQIKESWQQAQQPSYATGAAKEMTVESESHHPKGSGSSRGAQWGTVIHELLETAMRQPGVSLNQLAHTMLEEQDLESTLVSEALDVVQGVVDSAIWQRALASDQRLVEVPFEYCAAGDDAEHPLPTIVRGVIDLVFQEEDGWVIVDYKTDAVTDDSLVDVVEHYRGQVVGYAETWERLTGQRVKEKGLYLTRMDRFVTIDG